MPRFVYTSLLYLIVPFVPLRLLWRGLRQPAYLRHWRERFGFYAIKSDKPVIWLHCVSVGETRAAEPLVKLLQQRHPQHQILMTHSTPTGRETGEQLFGDTVLRVYLPYDLPDAVGRFLRHFKPEIGMLMETELWFNLIAACKKQQIPLLLVNARLSQKSAHGYAQVSRLTSQGLASLSAIAAQTDIDAERLQNLGASNVKVMGNIKFDVNPPADAIEKGQHLRDVLGKNRPVFLAASTRDGEETLILDAVTSLQIPNLLTVIVPRHPQRFDEVATLLRKRGIHFQRRSQLNADLPLTTQVVLGDSMGEMFTYYAACDVAFIGGSLLPLGGQNLIEACTMSKPVLIGPHTFNFTLATEQAIAAKAAWRLKNTDDLVLALQRLFGDSELRQSMSWAALNFSQSASGATERIADLVDQHLNH
ncbi:MAG: lipid IV(A) 3-deoxy-D-manno-octulosonic acid transferase [Methylophilaceae bacterium]|nr:lipid IV(A) 3-deoxy-D-manno-octulosonic acid transferase [Methyloradius sp.]